MTAFILFYPVSSSFEIRKQISKYAFPCCLQLQLFHDPDDSSEGKARDCNQRETIHQVNRLTVKQLKLRKVKRVVVVVVVVVGVFLNCYRRRSCHC